MPSRIGSALLTAAALMHCAAVNGAVTFPILSSVVRLEASGSVALSGESALVGNQVFVRSANGWVFQQTLEGFGPAALDGNTAVVWTNIYARVGTNWTRQGTLPVWESVALSGDTVAVRVPDWGFVYVFVRRGSTWTEQALLPAEPVGIPTILGTSVAISGTNLVVGVDGTYKQAPGAYVYALSGTNWSERARLVDSLGSSEDFAGAVCISGNTVALSSPKSRSILMFVETNGGWTFQQRLPIPAGLPAFPDVNPLSLNGSTLAAADSAGAVHIFTRRGTIWSEQQQLRSEALYGLGPNVALGTNAIVVDAWGSGGSFVYEPQAQWQSVDIGPVGLPGKYTASTNGLLVSGAGADIGGNADACHFVFLPWSGDLQALVKVTQTSGTDDWARGGIMFRGSLEPGAPQAFISLRQAGATSFQTRTITGGDTLFTNLSWVTAPYWLKLVKRGNLVTAYESLDAETWWEVASNGISFPKNFYVGLAVTSHTTNSLATIKFEQADFTSSTLPPAPAGLTAVPTAIDQIQLSWSNNCVTAAGFLVKWFGKVVGTLPASATNFTASGLFANSSYSYTVQAFVPGGNTGPESAPAEATTWKLPAGWQSQDVGTVTNAGDAYFNDQGPYPVGFMVSGTGNLTDPADSFHFLFQPWTGDFDFRADVLNFYQNAFGVRAGLMARASLAPDSPYVMLSVSDVEGDKFLVRGTNGHTAQLSLPNPTSNGRFRLVRKGSTLSAFRWEDGALVLVAQTNTDLPETLYLGFAVTGQGTVSPANAEFSNVYLAGGTNVFPLSPPNVSAIAASDNEIDVSWTNSNRTTVQYVLEQWPPAGNFPHNDLATLPANTTFFAHTNLNPGMTEHYRLRVQLQDGDWLWSSRVAATTLPPPQGWPPLWQSQDIGPTGVTGFATASDTYGFSVYGAGSGAGSEDGDSFQYAFWKLDGDGYIKARLAESTFVSEYEELGLMLRQSLDPSSASVFVFFTPYNGMGFLARPKQGGRVIYPGSYGATPRDWFKLDRNGNNVSAYISGDGQTWERMGTAQIALTNTVLVGLMVSVQGTVGTFNPVQIGPAKPPVLFLSRPRTNGTAQIEVGSLPGWTNAVEVSADLIHWSLWQQRISTSGFLTFTGDRTTANPSLFYRAVISP